MAIREIHIPEIPTNTENQQIFREDEVNEMIGYVRIARPDEYFFVVPELALKQRKEEYKKLKKSGSAHDKQKLAYLNELLKMNGCYEVYEEYSEPHIISNNSLDNNDQKSPIKQENMKEPKVVKHSLPMEPSVPSSENVEILRGDSADWMKGEKLLVYFDIMGFRAKMSSLSHDALLQEFVKLRNEWEARMKPLKAGDYIRMTQFSDTILLVANGVDEKHFNLITKAAIRIIQCSLENGFAIKGVMSQGEFSVIGEKQIYFGRPLVDAYELFEDLYFYGILVHHSAEKTIKKFASDSNPYYEGTVTLKTSKPKHCYLGWWMLDNKLAIKNNKKEANEWINNLEMNASGKVRVYMQNTYKMIEDSKALITKKKKESKNSNKKGK